MELDRAEYVYQLRIRRVASCVRIDGIASAVDESISRCTRGVFSYLEELPRIRGSFESRASTLVGLNMQHTVTACRTCGIGANVSNPCSYASI